MFTALPTSFPVRVLAERSDCIQGCKQCLPAGFAQEAPASSSILGEKRRRSRREAGCVANPANSNRLTHCIRQRSSSLRCDLWIKSKKKKKLSGMHAVNFEPSWGGGKKKKKRRAAAETCSQMNDVPGLASRGGGTDAVQERHTQEKWPL